VVGSEWWLVASGCWWRAWWLAMRIWKFLFQACGRGKGNNILRFYWIVNRKVNFGLNWWMKNSLGT
jgi:hypothetical protein